MNGYIYKLTLLKDTKTYKKGEVYIGQHCGNSNSYFSSGRLPNLIKEKYGKEIFKREIIHFSNCLSNRSAWEIFFINLYCCNRLITGKGLNLNDGRKIRFDDISGENNPNYGNNWSEEEKTRMSRIKKEYYKDNTEALALLVENGKKASKILKEKLKCPKYKKQFSQSVSKGKQKYYICKFGRNNRLIKEYKSIHEILNENPEYKRNVILSCCNGWKKTYKDFIWRYKCVKTGKLIPVEIKG